LAEIADVYARLCGRRDIELLMTVDCHSALKLIHEHKFDLIIVDVSLAGQESGLELVREIRKFDKKTKLMVLTGHFDKYKDEAYQAGADLYEQKPFDIKEHIFKVLETNG
jgi:CheY-like chemotaxis protein